MRKKNQLQQRIFPIPLIESLCYSIVTISTCTDVATICHSHDTSPITSYKTVLKQSKKVCFHYSGTMNLQVENPHRTPSHLHQDKTCFGIVGSYECEFCGKCFGARKDYEGHKNVRHLFHKPYQCQLCLKSFGYKRSLQHHSKVNHGFDYK